MCPCAKSCLSKHNTALTLICSPAQLVFIHNGWLSSCANSEKSLLTPSCRRKQKVLMWSSFIWSTPEMRRHSCSRSVSTPGFPSGLLVDWCVLRGQRAVTSDWSSRNVNKIWNFRICSQVRSGEQLRDGRTSWAGYLVSPTTSWFDLWWRHERLQSGFGLTWMTSHWSRRQVWTGYNNLPKFHRLTVKCLIFVTFEVFGEFVFLVFVFLYLPSWLIQSRIR